MKQRRTRVILAVALPLLLALGILLFRLLSAPDLDALLHPEGEGGAEAARIARAIQALSDEENRAEVITNIETDERVLSLCFQGLSDQETNESVLHLLKQAGARADFCISGSLAVEHADFVKTLVKSGQALASNSLFDEVRLEEYPAEELVDKFVRTNLIFRSIVKQEPKLLLCNGTEYTDALLKAAYVSGNTKLVKPSEFLSYQSFQSYEQVVSYLRKLERGSIIAIRMQGVLQEGEYNKPPEQKRPEGERELEDAPPRPMDALSPEERLVQIVDWLLQAIEETGYEIVPLEMLPTRQGGAPKAEGGAGGGTGAGGGAGAGQGKPARPITRPPAGSTGGKPPAQPPLPQEELARLRAENAGRLAEEHHTVHTTEQALSYTFYGIANQAVLEGVLESLDQLGAAASFFVSKRDLTLHRQEILNIHARGHEIGIALTESQDRDFDSTLRTILEMQEQLARITGKPPTLVRYPYYINLDEEILEAISAAGAVLVWEDLSVASSKMGQEATLEYIMANLFSPRNRVVQRGYIIYFRMDYYKDPALVPELALAIAARRMDTIRYRDNGFENSSAYQLKPLGELLGGEGRYDYPIGREQMLPQLRDLIHPGQLSGSTREEIFEEIASRYIGNPHINSSNNLPGFTAEEIARIDSSGRFTEEPVIFLTFDDWSSDKPVNQLLYVLEKHQVKAAFFIRTNYMQNNPNLLRAIAEAGHDVGNHSDEHLPLANLQGGGEADEDDTRSQYLSLSQEEAAARQEDLHTAHQKILGVVGDIAIEGRPAFVNIFRPPTLAVSREGIEAVFDLGFAYIVSGDFSSHDYEDSDPRVLADKLIHGLTTRGGDHVEIQNGSVVVMHMHDTSDFPDQTPNVTAEALDIAIPILKAKGYHFARLSDYLS